MKTDGLTVSDSFCAGLLTRTPTNPLQQKKRCSSSSSTVAATILKDTILVYRDQNEKLTGVLDNKSESLRIVLGVSVLAEEHDIEPVAGAAVVEMFLRTPMQIHTRISNDIIFLG